jgi:hypothetical protein
MPFEEGIETEPSPGGPVRRRIRIFLANLDVALGWALKLSCKGCAHRLFTTARWLVPEAQRFIVLRTGSHDHDRRILKFAANLSSLLNQLVPLKVVAGALIVLALLGSLEFVMRATAIITQPLVGDSAFQLESQIEPAHATGMRSEAIPLPTRKPRSAYSVSNETGSIPRTKERMAQQKRARHKPRR